MRTRRLSPTTIAGIDGKTAIEAALRKLAFVPVPSAYKDNPLPASVDTIPPGYVTFRIYTPSDTTMSPVDGITATAEGE